MFENSLITMNKAYFSNGTYGSSNASSGYSSSDFSCNSVFSYGGGYSSPMSYYGGCQSYGGYGGFLTPFTQNIMDMMTTFSTLNTTNNIVSGNNNNYSSNNSYSAYSWMPMLNFSYSKKSQPTNNKKQSYSFNSSSFNSNTNLPALKNVGYNPEKGEKLAKSLAKNAVGFTHQCARYLRHGLEETGMGTGERGDGCDYVGILSRNPNFKEVSASGLNLSALPAGCILVYNKGVAGYSSEAGHVEATTGTGKAISDGVTNNIRDGARVFVPV